MSTETPSSSASGSPAFTVTPYRPDGGFDLPGLMVLFPALILAGAVLGFAAHWVSQAIYLIIVFPLFIGLGLGFVGRTMVHKGRVRNPWIAGLAGFLGGALAMSMMHYFDYEQFRDQVARFSPQIEELARMSAEQRQAVLRPDLTSDRRNALDEAIKAVQVHNLLDFMKYQAEIGVQIKHGHSKYDSGMNLGYTGSWLYWFIELFIVAAITYGMVRSAAAEPYCAACGQWKAPKVAGLLSKDAVAPLQRGDVAGAAAASLAREPAVFPVRLTMACCEACSGRSGIDVKLEQLTKDRKGNVQATKLAHITYPAEARPPLEAMFGPPAVTTAAAESPSAAAS